MSNLSPQESNKVEHHLAKAEEIHNKLPAEHHDIIGKHEEHFTTYINKTVRTGEEPSTTGLRAHIASRMGNEVDKVKTEKAKAAKTENMNSALAYHDKHESHFAKALQIHHHVQAAKDVLTHGLHKAQETHNPMSQSIDDKKTDPEGYVVKHRGQIVKMVNRAKFSQANFNAKNSFKNLSGSSPDQTNINPVQESTDQEHTAVMAFGRFNPPTVGHEKLIHKVEQTAKSVGGSAHIIASHSEGDSKNPLPSDKKVEYIKKVADHGTHVSASSKAQPTLLHHAAALHKHVRHLVVVAGQDRVQQFHDLLHKYNGKEGPHGYYNFKSIKVVSAGQRDPDAEGTEGMSGTKMREHANNGNEAAFRRGLPKALHPHASEMMKHIQRATGAEKAKPKSSAPKTIKKVIRERLEETAAWQRKEGKNPEGGLNQKGIESYRNEHPGSTLKTAVTTDPSKLKTGSKSANRRLSFCARMKGMKAKLTSAKTARDPDARINKALRSWNC